METQTESKQILTHTAKVLVDKYFAGLLSTSKCVLNCIMSIVSNTMRDYSNRRDATQSALSIVRKILVYCGDGVISCLAAWKYKINRKSKRLNPAGWLGHNFRLHLVNRNFSVNHATALLQFGWDR